MTIEALQERLQQLEDTLATLRDLITRLDNLDFSAGAVPLPGHSSSEGAELSPADDVAQELAEEIKTLIRDEDEELDLLGEEVADLRVSGQGSDGEHARTRLREGVARVGREVKICRTHFRRAQLNARKSLLAAQRRERALLLASYSQPPLPPSSTSPDSPTTPQTTTLLKHRPLRTQNPRAPTAEVTASTSVTLALRQTHALIAGEVHKSAFAAQTLQESSEALASLSDRYTDLSGMLKASRALVSGLMRANKSDTWYLTMAAYLLAGTLGWIVFRRIFWGPLWLFVWWPVRMLFGVAWGTGRAVGRGVGGLGGGKEGASMVVDGGKGREKVVGITEGSVPTVSVGGEKQGQEQKGDPESMVEKVGKIIDGEDGEQSHGEGDVGADGERAKADAPNTKKRMWEEEKEAAKQAERVKDEL